MSSSDTPTVSDPAGKAAPRGKAGKLAVLAVTLAALGALAWWWWQESHYETTDDAYITGHVANVAPQVPGRVLEVLADDNRRVQEGDVLLRLDPAIFQAELGQARANHEEARERLRESQSQHRASLAALEQAQADAASAEAQAANASTDLSRYSQLVRTGAVSQQAQDNAQTLARTTASALLGARKRVAAAEAQADLAAAQINTARAAVERYRAAMEKETLQVAYTEVRAGLSGRVTRKAVEPGDYVQAGQAVLALVGDDVWVVANFKETQIQGMRPGMPVTFTVDAYPGRTFTGKIDSLQAGTGSAFSLLPPQNASGNFVKVVQRVPVKIVPDALPDGKELHLAPGMSVMPRVLVR
ncbi:Multidrug export protein EmrA [Fundidesulfovibrio magnetotacticus]|uniref:Multidrug export protein EmrA n=1 Tax=Fundidesulfovibrio magnetotacticus TaxID=2730080 RepID=A0A6V8LMA9_9BACT|nr:HlyD family secretion protein [Fundidesulfovibrio magnetotacticus]GFK93812.1 Multidrug export protein EmrA [Fundidesulfovibrio magnetotacticus]